MIAQPGLTSLVHVTGFLTGAGLYAMLGVMVLRARRGGEQNADHIPLATAVLGLVWNVGALVVYGARDLGIAGPVPLFGAVAFSALGFLPAVVVHAALQETPTRARYVVTGTAYALSTVAAAMQLWSAATLGISPYAPALMLLTIGYAVVVGAVVLRLRSQHSGRGPIAAVALAAFAVMALHLSHHQGGAEPFEIELLGHHASLPLALVILYQDYRFALVDLFFKRALAVLALIAITLVWYATIIAPFALPRIARDPADPRATAVLLVLCIATAIVYPMVRRVSNAFVDRVMLRRANYGELRSTIATQLNALESPPAVLDALCATLGPALSATRATWEDAPDALPLAPEWADARHQALCVPVHTTEAPRFRVIVGDLLEGRRLLSDDVAMLEAAAALAARRIDAIRVARERFEREAREHEIERLAAEAELRALRAQLNPHFLFNSLTTIGQLVQEAPDRALATLLRLTGLLRAVLRPTVGELVSLGEEIDIVESYLAIEEARFEERLRVTVDVPPEARALRVPPLVLQPLVENAVKHGIAPLREGGTVIVSARVERGDEGDRLHLTVADTGIGMTPAEMARRRGAGLGLTNVEQRLERLYGGRATLAVRGTPGIGTSIEIWLPAEGLRALDVARPATRTSRGAA